jgi:UDP-glucose:(heptosyl)LPS alpha-1,3-glucosyltransferase
LEHIAISRRLILGLSGAAKIIQSHVNHFSDKGVKIDIYHQKSKKMTYGHNVRTQKISNFFAKNTDLTFAKTVQKKLDPKKYDVRIGHGDDWSSNLVFVHNLNARLHEELYHEAKTKLNPNDIVQKELLENHRFTHLIANSLLTKNDIIERYGIPSQEISVIYPGYDESIFNLQNKNRIKEASHLKHGVPQNGFKIGFYTSGGFNKRGIDIFIDTLRLIPQTILDNSFIIIVGKTDDQKKIRLELKSVGLKESQFKIFEPIQDVLSLLCLSDIIVHPAYFEEFGMIVQEALAIGIPVLSSLKVGAIEINQNQLIIAPNKPDAETFSNQLEVLFNDSSKYKQLSELSANSTLKNTFKFHLEKLDNVIKNLK